MTPEPTARTERAHPRYRTNLDARLCGTRVSVRNLSMTGAQAACNAMFFQFLRPRLHQPAVELDLPVAGAVLRLPCQVVYVNEDGDDILVGLRLAADDAADLHAFRAYVTELAASAPETV